MKKRAYVALLCFSVFIFTGSIVCSEQYEPEEQVETDIAPEDVEWENVNIDENMGEEGSNSGEESSAENTDESKEVQDPDDLY